MGCKECTLLIVTDLRVRLLHIAVEYMAQFLILGTVLVIFRFHALRCQKIDEGLCSLPQKIIALSLRKSPFDVMTNDGGKSAVILAITSISSACTCEGFCR